jgi:hypothetical protein
MRGSKSGSPAAPRHILSDHAFEVPGRVPHEIIAGRGKACSHSHTGGWLPSHPRRPRLPTHQPRRRRRDRLCTVRLVPMFTPARVTTDHAKLIFLFPLDHQHYIGLHHLVHS